ncbi:membrane-spanning 4-domains subfamily A member 5-like [Pseudorasbora parva]|uniref:membrane-spanning 4-domains subfamily A member 5-like n=1 Tax=Pseudorasbora parva TaxID=51549 RepID=UPI00351F4339
METSKVISTDKATVVIQVNPQVTQNTINGDDGQETRRAYGNTALAEFFKAQPKALGTVQIMIGVVIFLFGIVRTIVSFRGPFISVFSGITFWGSLIYIAAGSLSVAAQNKLHLCVVKASLIMNVLSAITAVADIVLMSIEMEMISGVSYYCYDCSTYVNLYWKTSDLGIIGIMLVFSITQFIISICISGFACKATCNRGSTVVNVALNQVFRVDTVNLQMSVVEIRRLAVETRNTPTLDNGD